MIAAEGSGPGHGNAQWRIAGYFAAPVSGSLPCTALRQRL
jgi:hypothetical protein